MTILSRIQWAVILVFIPAIALLGWYSHERLTEDSFQQVEHRARLMMAGAEAVRAYTVAEVSPLLDRQVHPGFLPQTVGAYASIRTLRLLTDELPSGRYREAMLNPTNPDDLATAWEEDVIARFRNDSTPKEVLGQRSTEEGEQLYLAQPITVRSGACLQCHGKPEDAPRNLLDRYGANHGFGWSLNEVVGARIVSVGMDKELERGRQFWLLGVGSMTGLLLVLLLVLALVVRASVTSRLSWLTLHVEAVTREEDEKEEFYDSGEDEIAVLAAAMNRMRRHLDRTNQRQR